MRTDKRSVKTPDQLMHELHQEYLKMQQGLTDQTIRLTAQQKSLPSKRLKCTVHSDPAYNSSKRSKISIKPKSPTPPTPPVVPPNRQYDPQEVVRQTEQLVSVSFWVLAGMLLLMGIMRGHITAGILSIPVALFAWKGRALARWHDARAARRKEAEKKAPEVTSADGSATPLTPSQP